MNLIFTPASCFLLRLGCLLALLSPGFRVLSAERLDRGVVAFPTGGGHVYIGWRLLATDAPDIAFDVLRAERPEGQRVKINGSPIADSTNFVDRDAQGRKFLYSVRAVVRGKTLAESEPVGVDEAGSIGGLKRIKFQGNYAAQKVGLGDWREELLVSTEGELLIHSTTFPANTRRVCLMQDRQYRTGVAAQTMGCFYPPLLGGRPMP